MGKDAKKPAAETATTSPVGKAKHAPEAKITLLVTKNPKKAGSKAHARYALYKNGMTVSQFLAAGGSRKDLTWDVEHKHIEIKAA